MVKNKTKKITLDDLILRKTQGDLDKLQIKYYDSQELGGKIEIRKIPLKKYMQLINGVNDDDMLENLEFMNVLIFECCPLFKENSKKLMETYRIDVPNELPAKILNDNMGEMQDICEIINSFYGLNGVQDKVKN